MTWPAASGWRLTASKRLRRLAKLGIRLRPARLVDSAAPGGRPVGPTRRLSLKKLRRHPHGLVLGEQLETGVLPRKLRHPEGRIRLCPPEIAEEIGRLAGANPPSRGAGGHDDRFPLRLIGLRELRSHNSWMHNAPLLMRGGRSHALRVHPDDAVPLGLEEGGEARLESEHGALVVPVALTDEMTPGTVALPHGWGHRGGWQLANRHGGANVNLLTSSGAGDLERLAGMAHLNGVPVRLRSASA